MIVRSYSLRSARRQYSHLDGLMALGTAIATGSGSGHTQGENGKLKYTNIWKKNMSYITLHSKIH